MDGFVLDVHPDPERREMVLWVKSDDGRVHPLREKFTPRFFVRGTPTDLRRLEDALAVTSTAKIGRLQMVDRICGLDHEPSQVLEVPVRDYDYLRRLADLVDRLGEHKRYELFDVDLRMSQRFFFEKRLFPFARLRAWTVGKYSVRDHPWKIDYVSPHLTTVEVHATPDAAAGRAPTFEDRVRSVRVGDEAYQSHDEAEVLRWIADAVARHDPDVVFTRGGDTFLLPYLTHRAEACGVKDFQLGRIPDPKKPRRREKSFFTYGRIRFKPAAHVLHGRLHVDLEGGWEAGLDGLVDLARVCGIPLQDLTRLGAGTAITAIQIDRAAREGRIIPWKKNAPEAFKTARELLVADRGAYIFEPAVGVHEDVVEFDFASLFPNIMVTKNLSAETILCDCCRGKESPLVVPQLNYHVCVNREGFVPRTLRPLVARREHFKKLRKSDPANRERYQDISDVYKWCLVTSFGYQGYKNAKFGRIECHEAINAWGREIILAATEAARDHGFEILHGIVDSLWLKRVHPWADPVAFGEVVSKEMGIPFEYQGRFKWIVFLPTRRGLGVDAPMIGALNRYYGCFEEPPGHSSRSQAGQEKDYLAGGALKVRGVELRQHSTPRVVRRAQESVLSTLAEADDARTFEAALPRAVRAVEPVLDELFAGRADLADLVHVNFVAQDLEDYRARTLAHAALVGLSKKGIRVAPGDSVRYVVLDASSRDATRRVVEARLVRGDERYDAPYYAGLVWRAVASLLLPFGWTEEQLMRAYQGQEQARLAAWV